MTKVTLTFRTEEEAEKFYNAVGFFISDKRTNMFRVFPKKVKLHG